MLHSPAAPLQQCFRASLNNNGQFIWAVRELLLTNILWRQHSYKTYFNQHTSAFALILYKYNSLFYFASENYSIIILKKSLQNIAELRTIVTLKIDQKKVRQDDENVT